MKETALTNTCPHCGTVTDTVSDPTSDRVPKPGNITICANCFEPSRFDEQMRTQKLDWNDLPPVFRKELLKIVTAAKARLPS